MRSGVAKIPEVSLDSLDVELVSILVRMEIACLTGEYDFPSRLNARRELFFWLRQIIECERYLKDNQYRNRN